jgi:hypothetical protein
MANGQEDSPRRTRFAIANSKSQIAKTNELNTENTEEKKEDKDFADSALRMTDHR